MNTQNNAYKPDALIAEDIDSALLVDGLAAEREQGITIDVTYRFFSTDSGGLCIGISGNPRNQAHGRGRHGVQTSRAGPGAPRLNAHDLLKSVRQ
jgi:hypothetical protein